MASRGPDGRDYDQEVVARAERQDVVLPSGEVVGQDVGVSELVDNVEARRSTASWLTGLVYFIFGVIAILIALRVLLELLGAKDVGFTRFVYGVSGPFVAPFQNIVGTPDIGSGSVLDFSSILAIIVYLLLAFIIAWALRLIIDRPASGVSATRTVGRRTGL